MVQLLTFCSFWNCHNVINNYSTPHFYIQQFLVIFTIIFHSWFFLYSVATYLCSCIIPFVSSCLRYGCHFPVVVWEIGGRRLGSASSPERFQFLELFQVEVSESFFTLFGVYDLIGMFTQNTAIRMYHTELTVCRYHFWMCKASWTMS